MLAEHLVEIEVDAVVTAAAEIGADEEAGDE